MTVIEIILIVDCVARK